MGTLLYILLILIREVFEKHFKVKTSDIRKERFLVLVTALGTLSRDNDDDNETGT